jgi:hypothetical protein
VQRLTDQDIRRLERARGWYHGGTGLTTVGLAVILVSLVVIGAYVNVEMGILIRVSALGIAWKRTGYPLEWLKLGGTAR